MNEKLFEWIHVVAQINRCCNTTSNIQTDHHFPRLTRYAVHLEYNNVTKGDRESLSLLFVVLMSDGEVFFVVVVCGCFCLLFVDERGKRLRSRLKLQNWEFRNGHLPVMHNSNSNDAP